MTIFFTLFLNCAFERYSTSAQAMALAYAVTASAQAVDAIRFNPAALGQLNKNEILCGYEYFLSGIEGLHNINIGFTRPVFDAGLGLAISEFGFAEQKEQTITIALGKALSKDLNLGIGGDLYLINNKRTGYGFAYGLDIAFLGKLYNKWTLGVYGHNLNQPQFGAFEEGQLNRELRAGLAYKPFEDICSEIDIAMIEKNLRVYMSGEFLILNTVFFRTGIKTNPSVVCAGTGIICKFIKVDYAVEYIPELPLTHNITLNFEF